MKTIKLSKFSTTTVCHQNYQAAFRVKEGKVYLLGLCCTNISVVQVLGQGEMDPLS